MSATSPPVAVRSPWILGRWRDLLLIVAVPLLVWPLLRGAERLWSAQQITAAAVLMAMGHHVPGFLRVYGDRELFRRFRLRFVLAPVLLLALTVPTSLAGNEAVLFTTMIWGTWHYLAQSYGFARIYDGRAGRGDALSARLDKALCFAWFFGTILLYSNATLGFVERAARCGVP